MAHSRLFPDLDEAELTLDSPRFRFGVLTVSPSSRDNCDCTTCTGKNGINTTVFSTSLEYNSANTSE
eukprot:6469506-Amphidinium_carterae.1